MRPGGASIGTSRGVRMRNQKKTGHMGATMSSSHRHKTPIRKTKCTYDDDETQTLNIITRFSNWCSKQFFKLKSTKSND